MSKKNNKMSGFTLLEILLVIGLLAVLVLLGLRLMQAQSKRSRTERAGQELQSIMQAAIYYHSVNHEWPVANLKSNCSEESSDTSFVKHYLPKDTQGNEEKSSFGTYYCWGEHSTEGSDYENAAIFDLYLPVKGKNACQTAKEIAGTLPNSHAVAEIDGESIDDCAEQTTYFIRSQVVPSAQSIQEKSGQSLQALGQCTPDGNTAECPDDLSFSQSTSSCCHVTNSSPTQYKIHFPACASGSSNKIVYMPAFITYMHSSDHYSAQTIYDRDYVYTSESTDPTVNRSANPEPSCTVPSTESNEQVCTLTLGVGMNSSSGAVIDLTNPVNPYVAGSVGAIYIASCMEDK